jgi:arylsulfatase A-like enzyme
LRDVFLERPPQGPGALLVEVGAAAVAVGLAVVVWRALRGAETRGRPLTHPLLAGLGVLLLAMVWLGIARLVPVAKYPPPPARPAAPAGAPNVVLIVADTLRADHLSCYGYGAIDTPHIDRLAEDGLRYAATFSQASWTRPSIATILSGLYPSSHGAIHKADILPDRVDTLAENLQRFGYRTVGFADNANISQAFNFQQGFDEYRYLAPSFFFMADEPAAQLALYSGLRLIRERFLSRWVDVHHYYQPAEVVTGEVTAWLARGGEPQPFFLFIHYMDAHDPYMVHPFNGEGYARVANPNPPPAVVERYRQLYDGGIVYLDEHVGALLDSLRTRNLYDRSLVVLTADHGEEFQEHGGWWHGTTLYDEQIHVPLLVKPPGNAAAGRVIEQLATSLDIAPTILAAAGAPIPATFQGHVLPLDADRPPAHQSVFSEEDFEGNVLQSVRTKEWKLMTANSDNPRGLPPEALFDLVADPREAKNLHAAQPAEAATLRTELSRSAVEARLHAGASERGGGDAATQERLRALGYVN